jgi:transcriptional regulator with XRE-family HTH domain
MTESDLRSIFGKNLKKYRVFKGLSQAKLAELVNISPNFISDLETGKRWLSSDTLVNLAEVLDVAVYSFLKSGETPSNEISTFIMTYTEKASKSITHAVINSLENLRNQFVS